jgi:hypothetical protein
MCSEKHYEDTWFIVAEEDWRLTEEHDTDSLLSYRPAESIEEGIKNRSARLAAASSSSAASLSPGGKGRPIGVNLGNAASAGDIEFLGRTFKTNLAEGTNTYVTDLVKLSIQASRWGLGDLVWYSWEPGKRKAHPGHGTTLVGWSKKAAREIYETIKHMDTLDHFDLVLVRRLQQSQNRLSGCYTSPSIGHYNEHISGCEGPEGWVRETSWKGKILRNTRPAPGEEMWFGEFLEKGVKWSAALRNLDEIPEWTTLWDQSFSEKVYELRDDATSGRGKRQMRQFDKHMRLRYWAREGEKAGELPESFECRFPLKLFPDTCKFVVRAFRRPSIPLKARLSWLRT